MEKDLPSLSERINRAMEANDLDRKEFVEEIGYSNINRGLRRLDHWLSGQEYPSSRDQLEMLSEVMVESPSELEEIIKIEERLDWLSVLEERRQDPTYYLVIQTYKYSAKRIELPDESTSDELSEKDAVEEARKRVKRTIENKSDLIQKTEGEYFYGILNTPTCKNYVFDESVEITSIDEDRVAPGIGYFQIDGHQFGFS